jgi:hypothetical protein
VAGGLFSAGDGHAAQGDCEISGTGIECPMERVELTFGLRDDWELAAPAARTPGGDWLTLGLGGTLDDAAYAALEGMFALLQRLLEVSRRDAIALASVAVDLRVTVGRSLDSMFDLLGGALAACRDGRQPRRLPLSFQRPGVGSRRRWRPRPLTPAEQAQARRILATAGLTPHRLARRERPVTFVDVLYRSSTFTELFQPAMGLDRRRARAVAGHSAQGTVRRGHQLDKDEPEHVPLAATRGLDAPATPFAQWSTCRCTPLSGRTSATTKPS